MLQGFKLGICSKPPVGVPNALLCLANNCAIAQTFSTMRERFAKLYKRRCVRSVPRCGYLLQVCS